MTNEELNQLRELLVRFDNEHTDRHSSEEKHYVAWMIELVMGELGYRGLAGVYARDWKS